MPYHKEFVNEQAFISQTDASLKDHGSISNGALVPLCRAFEEDDKDKVAWTMAAALWILNDGVTIYRASFHSEYQGAEDLYHGKKYETALDASSKGGFKASLQHLRTIIPCTSSDASKHNHKSDLTPHRWSFWKQGFLDAAANRDEISASSSECGELALEAARRMDELEAQFAPTPKSSFEKEAKTIELKA